MQIRITILDRPRDVFPDNHLPAIIASNTIVPILRDRRSRVSHRFSITSTTLLLLTGIDPWIQTKSDIELTRLLPLMSML